MGCVSAVAVSTEECVAPGQGVLSAPAAFEQEYSIGELLGKGAFGRVYGVSHRSTGRQCAVKLIDMADKQLSQEQAIEWASVAHQKVNAEVDAWQAVGKHPNIVEFRGWFIEESYAFLMVMERCSCSVTEKLKSPAAPRKSDMPWLLREMLLGVQACHLARVVHKDIKSDNFLVGKDGKVKLCDFGMAVHLKPDAGDAPLKGEAGTPPLMSPEMVQGKRYGISTDVWSFGAMAYFIVFRELPYIPEKITSKAAKDAIRAGEPKPRFLQGALRPVAALLQGLLERDPADRVTATEALEHFYLREQVKSLVGHVDSASTLSPMDDRSDDLSSTDSQIDSEFSH